MSVIEQLRARSPEFLGKVIVTREEHSAAIAELMKRPAIRATPDDDLRYIEGLLDLPYGLVTSFYCEPDPASAKCRCGREPNAADIVAYALRKSVHSRQVIRDAILGIEPIFEPSDGGRTGACLQCSRAVTMRGYWRAGYMYA